MAPVDLEPEVTVEHLEERAQAGHRELLDGAALLTHEVLVRLVGAVVHGSAVPEVHVVDDPEHCDFYYPAVVHRGNLQLAISTNGLSPALAHRIRRELEEQFGPEYGEWLEQLGKIRRELFASAIHPDERRRLLHRLASREAFAQAQSAAIHIEHSSHGELS